MGGNLSSKQDGMFPKKAAREVQQEPSHLSAWHRRGQHRLPLPQHRETEAQSRARLGERSGPGQQQGCLWEPVPPRGSAELAEEEETRRSRRGWFAGMSTHRGSLSPILAPGHSGGNPLPPPRPAQLRGRGPPASGTGGSLFCQWSSGRGQGQRGLSGCPPAIADLRGML